MTSAHRMMKTACAAAFVLIAVGTIGAQQASRGGGTAPAPTRVAIRAGRLLDVRTGRVASDVVILIEDDRIASVGGAVPSGMRVIDLSGLTVLPGLVDAHAHVLGNPKN